MISRRELTLGAGALLLGGAIAGTHVPTPDRRTLAERLAAIEAEVGGRLGVAMLDTATGAVAGHRLDERFALCSTFKALAAAAVLARVDAGRDSIDRRVHYTAGELVTYSPITKDHVGEAGHDARRTVRGGRHPERQHRRQSAARRHRRARRA